MTSERWQQIKTVLAHALDLEPSGRDSYLDQACGSDSLLREEVERLLRADSMVGDRFLESPLATGRTLDFQEAVDRWVDRHVGAYRIVGPLGSGGMGEVYRAVRADAQYRSQVAIKLVRPGPGAGSIINRFKTERQILADLNHRQGVRHRWWDTYRTQRLPRSHRVVSEKSGFVHWVGKRGAPESRLGERGLVRAQASCRPSARRAPARRSASTRAGRAEDRRTAVGANAGERRPPVRHHHHV